MTKLLLQAVFVVLSKRHCLNRLKVPMKEEQCREKADELGRVDYHPLAKEMISKGNGYYLVCIIGRSR